MARFGYTVRTSLRHSMSDDEIADQKFGLPRLKKYPMPDEKHVRSAIKFFNYVSPEDEKELAEAILDRIDDYDIDPETIHVGDENRFKKYFDDEFSIKHHGIKGQKWGVRRYQNADGSLTDAGRQRALEKRNVVRNKPHTDDINDIVNTLSSKEKRFLGAPLKGNWIDKKYENETLKEKAVSFVSKDGDTPVSFVEVWTNGGTTGQIALATRNDPKYRGKGYASKNVKEAIDWCDRYGKKSISELEWIADRNNTASVNLGKKYGFIEDDPNKHGHDWTEDWSKEYAIMYRPVGTNHK